MICFFVMGFCPHHPGIDSVMADSDHLLSAVVYANDREECKHVLRTKLIRMGNLSFVKPDDWVITPLTPESDSTYAVVMDPHRRNIRK